ncbi:cAMP-dependent protein kinase type II regulatory subunit isoform 2 [Schistosoma japonicum]|uniref:cAMP-dependent protein kinase type II regulatory subunit n=1 Tax=Schistosoma japonicum TaxID=6182 RepID=A0A4Z2CNG3_SCHJA|nr:cAMP-dependent protein kinase type II regulatory subunit isoform 2 [Schistosoma japonicum]
MSILANIRNFFDHVGENLNNTFRSPGRLQRINQNDANSSTPFPVGPPRNSLLRRQSVAAESFDPEKDSDDNNEEERQIYPKSDSQRARLTNAVKEILLFRCLDEEQKSKVIDAMQEMKVKQGDVVITQGDDGDNFYVIESGTYDIYVRQNQSSNEKLGEKVGSYNGQGSFGELALMYNTSRAASIVAATDGILWLMDRNTFRRIVLKAAFHKRQAYIELLEDIPLLKELSSYERTNVADALQSRVYQDGATIITQGETGKEMFIIESGTVRISVKENSEEVELSRVGKGAYFGELALITKRPRAASAYAVGQTKVAVLDVASFERLMGPCLKVMQRNIDTYEKQLNELLGTDRHLKLNEFKSK